MGSYSIFEVNKAYHWEYNYHIPYFFLFIFENSDFSKETYKEDGEEWFSFLGYKSRAGKCLKKLDEYGYTKNFFQEVTDEIILPNYNEHLEYLLEERACSLVSDSENKEEVSLKVKELKKIFSNIKKVGNFVIPKDCNSLSVFTAFLKYLADNKPQKELANLCLKSKYKKKLLTNTSPKRERDYLEYKVERIFSKNSRGFGKKLKGIDLEELISLISDFPDVFGKKIHLGSFIFSNDFGVDYGEIFDLIQMQIILSAVHPNTTVSINISELMDGTLSEAEHEAKGMKQEISNQVFRKMKIYTKVYEILSNRGSKKNLYFGKKLLKDKFLDIDNFAKSQDRGRKYEDFLDELFSMSENMSVVSKRLNLSDQEIDLVTENNIPTPYMQNFHSPHLMIEAKFTQKKIGSSDIRDFRSKMEDHGHLCKIGFFFSVSGFSKEVKDALKRSKNETIVCVDRNEILEYLDSTQKPEDWVQSLLKKKSFV